MMSPYSAKHVSESVGSVGMRRVHQAGFSLIELMIAVAIGLIILLAVSVLFSQVSTGSRVTDDASRATENGNFSLRVLGDSLRAAGFAGLSNQPAKIVSDVPGKISAVAAENCGSVAWPFLMNSPNNGNPIIQYFPPPLAASPLPCIPAGTVDINNPVFVVRHATGIQAAPAALIAGNEGFFVQSGASGGGVLFMGEDYVNNIVAGDKSPPPVCRNSNFFGDSVPCTNSPAPIFEYVVYVYYVRPCSRPTGPLVGGQPSCQAIDDNGNNIPTLVRRQLIGNPARFVEVAVAEGVERFALQFQDATGATLTAANADGLMLATARSARLSVLMRSSSADTTGYDDSPFSYPLVGGGVPFNCGASGTLPCRYRRTLYNDSVALKNN